MFISRIYRKLSNLFERVKNCYPWASQFLSKPHPNLISAGVSAILVISTRNGGGARALGSLTSLVLPDTLRHHRVFTLH